MPNHKRHAISTPSSVGGAKKLAAGAAATLMRWNLVMQTVDSLLPDRVTIRQAVFLSAVASASALGHKITQSEIFEEYEGTVGRSLSKSAALFFEPTHTYPGALGWLSQVEDPHDRRRKFIELTDKGRAAINAMVETIQTVMEDKGAKT